jgi:hypothetical protein
MVQVIAIKSAVCETCSTAMPLNMCF